MKVAGILVSVFGAIIMAIMLGVAMGENCKQHKKTCTHHTTKQEKHKEEKEYRGPHLSVIPIGPRLFGPFHLGF